jgi:hypothetical protein
VKTLRISSGESLDKVNLEYLQKYSLLFVTETEGNGIFSRRKESGLFIDAVGIGFQQPNLSLLIPWKNMNMELPCDLYEGHIRLHILSAQVGLGIIVKSSKECCDDEFESFPLQFEGLRVLIQETLPVDVFNILSLIRSLSKEFHSTVTSQFVDAAFLKHSELEVLSKQCMIRVPLESFRFNFPSFCPYTGEECSQMTSFPVSSTHQDLRWFVSAKGKKQRQRAWKWRLAGWVIPSIAYLSYGFWVMSTLETTQPSFPYYEALKGLSFYLLTIAFYFWAEEQMSIDIDEDQHVILRFKSREYFDALLDLNNT